MSKGIDYSKWDRFGSDEEDDGDNKLKNSADHNISVRGCYVSIVHKETGSHPFPRSKIQVEGGSISHHFWVKPGYEASWSRLPKLPDVHHIPDTPDAILRRICLCKLKPKRNEVGKQTRPPVYFVWFIIEFKPNAECDKKDWLKMHFNKELEIERKFRAEDRDGLKASFRLEKPKNSTIGEVRHKTCQDGKLPKSTLL